MKISIIIPNRDRDSEFLLCAAALNAVARPTDVELEIIEVSDAETFSHGIAPVLMMRNLTLAIPRGPDPFCKPRFLNAGIDAATGDVLTFLDADAIVPPAFFDTIQLLDDPTLTKLCYRVRRIPMEQVAPLTDAPDKRQFIGDLFSRYDEYPLSFEAYGRPDWDRPRKPGEAVFGNSQFSIRRETLGDLRFDESYVGRGYEDLDLNLRIWERYGDNYRAEIVTDAEHALLHVTDPSHNVHWGDNSGNYNYQNSRRYLRREAECLKKLTATPLRA